MLALAGMATRSTASAATAMRMGAVVNGFPSTIMPPERYIGVRPLFTLSARMESLVQLLQARPRDVCVDLRRRDVRVAEHHLHAAQVRAVLEEVRREGMPQDVRRDVRLDPRLARVAGDLHPERLPRHRPPA